MTPENQELLIKDLCGRIQHGVKCQVYNFSIPYTLSGINPSRVYQELYFGELDYKECNGFVDIKHCKPYLLPLSSLTKEQKKEISKRYNYHSCYGVYVEITNHADYWDDDTSCNLQDYLWLEDFFNRNNIDYRGLIPLGLANDATGLNIY